MGSQPSLLLSKLSLLLLFSLTADNVGAAAVQKTTAPQTDTIAVNSSLSFLTTKANNNNVTTTLSSPAVVRTAAFIKALDEAYALVNQTDNEPKEVNAVLQMLIDSKVRAMALPFGSKAWCPSLQVRESNAS